MWVKDNVTQNICGGENNCAFFSKCVVFASFLYQILWVQSYQPINAQHWVTPAVFNASCTNSFSPPGGRLWPELTLLLRRSWLVCHWPGSDFTVEIFRSIQYCSGEAVRPIKSIVCIKADINTDMFYHVSMSMLFLGCRLDWFISVLFCIVLRTWPWRFASSNFNFFFLVVTHVCIGAYRFLWNMKSYCTRGILDPTCWTLWSRNFLLKWREHVLASEWIQICP